MENIQEFLNIHLPTIISYAITITLSILLFIIKMKIGNSNKTLKTLMKEKITYLDKENAELKLYVNKETNMVLTRLNEIEKQNAALTRENIRLKELHEKSKNVIKTIIEEDNYEIPIE